MDSKDEIFLENLFLEAYNNGLNNFSDFEEKIDLIYDRTIRSVCKEVYLCGKFDFEHSDPSEEEKKLIHWIIIGPQDAVRYGIDKVQELQRKKEKERNALIVNYFW